MAEAMILDRVLPDAEFAYATHAVVDAGPDATWQAVLNANLLDGRLTRALFALRELPSTLLRRERPAPLPRVTFGGFGDVEGWVRLGEEPGRELVLGAIGRFWQRGYGWREVAPEDFVAFDEPGYAKTVAGISLRPYGARTLLSYESRTVTTSAGARCRFRPYWLLLRPGIGVVMRSAVAAIRAEAERPRPTGATPAH